MSFFTPSFMVMIRHFKSYVNPFLPTKAIFIKQKAKITKSPSKSRSKAPKFEGLSLKLCFSLVF